MNAKELRIGNWIETEFGIKQVIGIDVDYHDDIINIPIICSEKFNDLFIRSFDFEPIPLTREILENISESKSKLFDMNIYHFGRYKVSHVEGKRYRFIFKDNPRAAYMFLKEIDYLHQLQNLYFALTNEELEIKL